MTDQEVCKFFQFGYCRFQDHCRKRHVNEICENLENCLEKNCEKRHPRLCVFYDRFNRCKFGEYCRYRHEEKVSIEKVVKKFSEDFELLRVQVSN